jgi:tetratricopeptide (TPR) repeat protein
MKSGLGEVGNDFDEVESSLPSKFHRESNYQKNARMSKKDHCEGGDFHLDSPRHIWYIFLAVSTTIMTRGQQMKSSVAIWSLSIVLASMLLFQGFQCASPEFSGAKLRMQQKDFKEAIRLLEIEVQKNPTNAEAWYMLGGLRADEMNYDGMNEAFHEAVKLNPKYAADVRNVRYNRWGFHLNAGANHLEEASADSAHHFDLAIEEFRKAVKAWPDTSLTYKYIGYAYNNKGDFKEAIKAYKKAWEVGKDVEAIKRAGNLLIIGGEELKGRFEQENAENLKNTRNLDEIKKNTRKADVMRVLGAPDNIKKGPRGTKKEDWTYNRFNLTLAIDNDRVVTKTFSKPYQPKVDSTYYHLAMQELSSAIEALEFAKGADRRDNETLRALLRAYVAADRIDEAALAFQGAIENDPDDKINRYILGVLLRTKGDYEGAATQFKAALEIDPEYLDAMFDLGATYYNWGVEIIRAAEEKGESTEAFKEKFEKALPHMEKVSKLRKDDVSVWETLGFIYARLNMQEKAIKAFDEADKIRKGS